MEGMYGVEGAALKLLSGIPRKGCDNSNFYCEAQGKERAKGRLRKVQNFLDPTGSLAFTLLVIS